MFFNFIRDVVAASPDNEIDVVYYLDKAKPGHYSRPDTARSTQCIYWTCLQFPQWFRSKRNGWIPFAYVPVASQDNCELTDGMLVKFVVNTFDSSASDLAFSKGCAVQGPQGDVVVIRAKRQLILADWGQHVKTYSLKGYNGIVPCGVCKNVIGRCQPFTDEYLVHIHSCEYHKFDRHTPESFAELAQRLKRTAEHNPGELQLEEKVSGLKWSADEIPWDDEMMGRLKPPLGAYPDWMHHFCASGGLAQYEVNGLLSKFVSKGIALADMDAWKNTVRLPSGYTSLSKSFFS